MQRQDFRYHLKVINEETEVEPRSEQYIKNEMKEVDKEDFRMLTLSIEPQQIRLPFNSFESVPIRIRNDNGCVVHFRVESNNPQSLTIHPYVGCLYPKEKTNITVTRRKQTSVTPMNENVILRIKYCSDCNKRRNNSPSQNEREADYFLTDERPEPDIRKQRNVRKKEYFISSSDGEQPGPLLCPNKYYYADRDRYQEVIAEGRNGEMKGKKYHFDSDDERELFCKDNGQARIHKKTREVEDCDCIFGGTKYDDIYHTCNVSPRKVKKCSCRRKPVVDEDVGVGEPLEKGSKEEKIPCVCKPCRLNEHHHEQHDPPKNKGFIRKRDIFNDGDDAHEGKHHGRCDTHICNNEKQKWRAKYACNEHSPCKSGDPRICNKCPHHEHQCHRKQTKPLREHGSSNDKYLCSLFQSRQKQEREASDSENECEYLYCCNSRDLRSLFPDVKNYFSDGGEDKKKKREQRQRDDFNENILSWIPFVLIILSVITVVVLALAYGDWLKIPKLYTPVAKPVSIWQKYIPTEI